MRTSKLWVLLIFLLLGILCSSCGVRQAYPDIKKSPSITSYVYLLGPHSFDIYGMPGAQLMVHRPVDSSTGANMTMTRASSGGVYLSINGEISFWKQKKQIWKTPIDSGNVKTLVEQSHYIVVATEQAIEVLNADTGKRVWQKPIMSGMFGSQVLLQMTGETDIPLVIMGQGMRIRAYDAQSGSVRWQVDMPPEDGSVIEDMHLDRVGDVFVTTATSIWMYQASSGRLLWSREDQALFFGEDTKRVYVALKPIPVISEDGNVKRGEVSIDAIESTSGMVQWHQYLPSFSQEDQGVVTPSSLIWVSTRGMVAWHLVDGRQVWQLQSMHLTGLVAQGSMVLGCEGDTLALLDGESGQQRWRKHVPGNENCNVQLDATAMYIQEGTGLLAVDYNGKEQWQLSLHTSNQYTWLIEQLK